MLHDGKFRQHLRIIHLEQALVHLHNFTARACQYAVLCGVFMYVRVSAPRKPSCPSLGLTLPHEPTPLMSFSKGECAPNGPDLTCRRASKEQ